MAMRYLAGKLEGPRRRRSPSSCGCGLPTPPLHQRLSGCSNATMDTTNELIAKMEAASRNIEETIRHNRFHKNCMILSAVVGIVIGGALGRWDGRRCRKALIEHLESIQIVHYTSEPPRRPN
uniref:Uncharacterized protein n=1 Tax=Leersia perrieri TaxID=77586 RepID=A0A0D9WVI5_9ORYZ